MIVPFLVLAFAIQQPQDTVVLKPLIVTATRVPVPADLISSAVTVLRGPDLAARGIRTVAEALEAVSGAHIVETGSFGGQTSLFLRGGENDYVKVLIDGVPLNQPGGGLDLAHFTTDNVDRIEVVRGPTSVLYGSDAMTGVIQIFTRTGGQGRTRIGAAARAGSYGSNQFAVDVEGGTPRIGYAVRASRFGADGLFPVNNEYRNSVVSGRIRIVPDDRTEASLSYRYGDDLYHFPTNSQGEPADSNQRSAERGPVASLALRRRLGAIDISTQATLREARQLFNDEPDSPGEDGAFWSNDYVRRAAAGLLLTWRARGSTAFSAGVDYEDERQRGRSEFSASFGTFPDSIRVRRWTAGYYAQALLDAWPLAITAGARLDDNSAFQTHGTYRVGLVFRPRTETRLRFSVGTGFKEPTFFENFARGFVLGNPNLEPERSTSWEAGIDRTLAGGRITVVATYFDQRFRDLIDFTLSPPPGEPNYFNVPGAISRGAELEASGTLTPAFVVTLRYTYLHARATKSGADTSADALFVPGKPLLRRPTHSLAPELGMTVGARTRIIVSARWIGRRDDLDFNRPAGSRRVTVDSYTHVNLSAEYTLGAVQLTGKVENAFDDRSAEIAAFRPRGRTLALGGRVTLGR